MAKTMAHPMGRMMFAAALVLEIVGILVFRKIIKIHI
jgi:Flp pilus assembly protein TadB